LTNNSISVFCSKECSFLFWLSEHSQKTSKGAVINFSQEDIAAEYGSSPATVNKWLQALQSTGCVEQKKKGSYCVTKTGYRVLAQMKRIERIIMGGTLCKPLD